MTSSKTMAQSVGPILAVVTASEFVNPNVWATVGAPDTYQAGMLAFIAGFFIVRMHNRWVLGWPVLITLLSWFGMLAGAGRMFATDMALRSAKDASVALGFQIALFATGAFLTVMGYTAADGKTADT